MFIPPEQPEKEQRGKSVGIIVLAAGSSSRLGTPKQLLTFHGETLLRRAARTAIQSNEQPVVAVIGAHAERMRMELSGLPVLIAHNEPWQDGMASSVVCGLTKLLNSSPNISAALFMLCDQPMLTAEKLQEIVRIYRDSGCAIAACAYSDGAGVPALFDRSLFPVLLALKGAQGAKRVIVAHPDLTMSIPFPDGKFDIDTPGDYERLERLHSGDDR